GLTLCAAACGLSAPWWAPGAVAAVSSLAGLAAIVGLNRGFFAFLARRKGWRFAGAAIPLHLVYYVCCGLSVVIAMTYWQLGRIRKRPDRPAAVPAPHLTAARSKGQRVK